MIWAMVHEVATINVKAGSEDEFIAAFQASRELLAGTPGCQSVRFTRGIEQPSRFVLLVQWDSLEAHVEGFRGTERFTEWLGHIGRYFDGDPSVEHFAEVD